MSQRKGFKGNLKNILNSINIKIQLIKVCGMHKAVLRGKFVALS